MPSRRPFDAQLELLPIEHRSLWPHRLRARKQPHNYVNAEAIYAAEWRRLQKQFDNQLLNMLLAPDDAPRDPFGRTRLVPISRRDAAVAATIVQWLGTNVGRGFVAMCERRIDEATRLRTELSVRRANQRVGYDTRTPLQRRKAVLDAARKRLRDAASKEG